MNSDPDHLSPRHFSSKRVLVAPLNWGLGHVSRCIPLIRALENMGAEVLLASDGVALHLLKAEFPHLETISLPSYKIRYFSRNMVLNIARQLPRILYAVRAEKWETERIVKSRGIQGIISDNRYGCFSGHASNVLITHQIHLKTPGKFLAWTANRILRLALTRFHEIWVPDNQRPPSLSGELSHPAIENPPVKYIGLLSRAVPPRQNSEVEYDVAVVLSGPEPQRRNLEQILLEQAMSLPQKFIFIQGKTKSKEHYYASENVEVVSYLTSSELNEVLAASRIVVCRSGYSSLMDLAANGKQAILIPTPGQTEQEYLAAYLSDGRLFIVQEQDQIDLEKALEEVEQTRGIEPSDFQINNFESVLKDWLESL